MYHDSPPSGLTPAPAHLGLEASCSSRTSTGEYVVSCAQVKVGFALAEATLIERRTPLRQPILEQLYAGSGLRKRTPQRGLQKRNERAGYGSSIRIQLEKENVSSTKWRGYQTHKRLPVLIHSSLHSTRCIPSTPSHSVPMNPGDQPFPLRDQPFF